MAIKISRKDWNNKTIRDVALALAELNADDILIVEQKRKPYNAQIWKDDDIVFEKDFDSRPSALKWIKARLKNESNAYADLKKYNHKRDDFDWWFFKFKDNKLVDVTDKGEVL